MIAVFLLDFGGPEKLDDIRPFLKNLFSDSAIMPMPAQEIFAHIIATFRAPKVAKQYEKIGGCSPLPQQSREIAAQLEYGLRLANLDVMVFVGMRYWTPTIDEVLGKIAAVKPQGIILIPMFPHYSTATTLSVLTEFQKAYDARRLNIPYQIVEWWHDLPEYIAAWCFSIQRALEKFDAASLSCAREKIPILFTAHSLPASFVKERKDPYPKQIRECAEKIMTYLGGDHPSYLSYQSKVGPIEWLKPATIEFVGELGTRGVRELVIVPISFITDHIETLFEIDHEIIHAATVAGIQRVVRCEALFYTPYLKKALEALVLKRLPSLLGG